MGLFDFIKQVEQPEFNNFEEFRGGSIIDEYKYNLKIKKELQELQKLQEEKKKYIFDVKETKKLFKIIQDEIKQGETSYICHKSRMYDNEQDYILPNDKIAEDCTILLKQHLPEFKFKYNSYSNYKGISIHCWAWCLKSLENNGFDTRKGNCPAEWFF